MDRRTFATTLAGIAAAAAPARSAETGRRTKLYTLETFQLKNGTQAGRMHDWLGNTALPKLAKIHAGPQIALEAVISPHTPQLVLMLGFSSFEDLMSTREKMAADKDLAATRQKLDEGSEPPFESQSVTLLESAAYAPEIVPEKRDKPRFFELRVYHSPTRNQLRLVHERFAGPETKIFAKSGIHPVLYTSTLFGPNMPNLTYLIPFDSLGAREKAWDTFGADPDWVKARKESIDKGGQIVAVAEVSIYKATPYSPVK
jgi:NIPSNAP protein